MTAEIITIGDELLIGQVTNTNATWIATALNGIGIDISTITTISDNREQILKTLQRAHQQTDITIITGGLGPTRDDITKNTLCEYFNTSLVFNPKCYEQVEKILRQNNVTITEINKKQAEVPQNATALINQNGTAPALWFEQKKKITIAMPGVPFEMKAIMTEHILPRLLSKFNTQNILHQTILTNGIGESTLAEIINSWELNLPQNFNLAYLPQPGMVRLRITGRGDDAKTLKDIMDQQVKQLQQLIPQYIFGYNNDTMEKVVSTLLKSQHATVCTAESCTGGLIAHRLTTLPGSSACYRGTLVAYHNDIKSQILHVNQAILNQYGAVSQPVVEQMASGAKELMNSTYAIATSGIAGPDGGTADKPVGTVWIAICTPDTSYSQRFSFGGNRQRINTKTTMAALNMLRKILLDQYSS